LLLSFQTPCDRCSKGKLIVAQFEGPLYLPGKASAAGSWFPESPHGHRGVITMKIYKEKIGERKGKKKKTL
jgi:hypothetical protein